MPQEFGQIFGPPVVAGTVLAAGVYPGTTTNDNAPAGDVGEYVESVVASGSALTLTTATAKTITSISLTAGDWDVSGSIHFVPANTTTVTALGLSYSLVTNSFDLTTQRYSSVGISYTSVGNEAANTGPTTRFSLATTTSIFLVALASFGVAGCTGFGFISARRVR